MKKMIILFCLSGFLKGTSQTPATDPHWQLVWEDTFDFFNTDNWIKANYCDYGGKPHLYLADNVWTDSGNLVIKIDYNPTDCTANPPNNPASACCWNNPCSVEGVHKYTSGWIESKEFRHQKYGFIEARIMAPYGYGLWPAFWTFWGSGTHTNAAEIDIFEMLGDLPPNISTTNIHRAYCEPDCPQPDYFSKVLMDNPYYNWNIYGIEWSPSKIIFYINDYPVRVIANHGITDKVRIIFNIGIGANGNMPCETYPCESSHMVFFPKYMYVDYLKVYDLNKDCEDYINTLKYDFSFYNNIEKNFIKIGGDGGSNTLTVGDDMVLRASQFVEFTSNFDVPLGASLYADADGNCLDNIDTACTQTFNPCTYNFVNYDNSVKKMIELGGYGCNVNITPTNFNIALEATDQVTLKPGVTITATSGKSVALKIVSCY